MPFRISNKMVEKGLVSGKNFQETHSLTYDFDD
jgi:hypothetical protein